MHYFDRIALSADEISVTPPARLVLMLYDDAIANLAEAVDAIGANDIAARCNATNRAMDIVCHLYLTLDMECGGQIAHNLSAIYGYILSHLQEINFRNDPAPALDAIKLLQPLRNSWMEVDERIRSGVIEPELPDLAATVIAHQALRNRRHG